MDPKFKKAAMRKFVENMLSVKVWVIIFLLVISTAMLINGFITGDVWAAVNGGVISTVFALREGFKVAKVKSEDDTENMMP